MCIILSNKLNDLHCLSHQDHLDLQKDGPEGEREREKVGERRIPLKRFGELSSPLTQQIASHISRPKLKVPIIIHLAFYIVSKCQRSSTCLPKKEEVKFHKFERKEKVCITKRLASSIPLSRLLGSLMPRGPVDVHGLGARDDGQREGGSGPEAV